MFNPDNFILGIKQRIYPKEEKPNFVIGDTIAIGNHKSPILGTISTFSCNSIVKGSNENGKEVVFVLLHGNGCPTPCSIPCFRPNLDSHVHSCVSNPMMFTNPNPCKHKMIVLSLGTMSNLRNGKSNSLITNISSLG